MLQCFCLDKTHVDTLCVMLEACEITCTCTRKCISCSVYTGNQVPQGKREQCKYKHKEMYFM